MAGYGHPVPASQPMILANGLVKAFGDFIAVDGIDVEVHQGESFGFLGPNGAGKSSTMRMIGCVSPPTAGTLTVLGMDPRTQGPQIRARLGVVPQRDSLDEELTDQGRIVAQGSPRELIDRYSTREVLELRFDSDEHGDHLRSVDGIADRVEVLPDRLLLYTCLIHISEPTRRTPISYAVFCLKKKKYAQYNN